MYCIYIIWYDMIWYDVIWYDIYIYNYIYMCRHDKLWQVGHALRKSQVQWELVPPILVHVITFRGFTVVVLSAAAACGTVSISRSKLNNACRWLSMYPQASQWHWFIFHVPVQPTACQRTRNCRCWLGPFEICLWMRWCCQQLTSNVMDVTGAKLIPSCTSCHRHLAP